MAPMSAPMVLVITSDVEVMRSRVKSWIVSTLTLSAAPSAVTTSTRRSPDQPDRPLRSERTPRTPNGRNNRMF